MAHDGPELKWVSPRIPLSRPHARNQSAGTTRKGLARPSKTVGVHMSGASKKVVRTYPVEMVRRQLLGRGGLFREDTALAAWMVCVGWNVWLATIVPGF